MTTRFGAGSSASIQAAPPPSLSMSMSKRRQPAGRVGRDLRHRARDLTPLAIGAVAEVVGGVDPKWKGPGEPLESRLNLTGGWRKCGRRSLSNRACLPGRSSNAAAKVDMPEVHRLR